MVPTDAGEQHWHSIASSAAKQVITVATQPASITASHDDQIITRENEWRSPPVPDAGGD
jgi:hypothetical protein